jgi:aerobic-type carbon monoxide dehydrogenase small subunit (CoxS/CutS family)
MAVSLRVNGHTFTSTADLDTPLLYILRNDLKLNGPKFGCGHGLCSSALSIGCGDGSRRDGRDDAENVARTD